jgi:hypothetical protein
MDYVYNYQIDTTLDEGGIKLIADTALKRARLKAPIKTGNLRKSIKYQINGDIVMLYIDTTMYDVPYYDYVNTAPKKDGSPRRGNKYWEYVIAEFGNVLYANLDKHFRDEIQKEKDEEKRKAEIQKKNEEIRAREKKNEEFTEVLKQLAVLYALQNIEQLQGLVNAKR